MEVARGGSSEAMGGKGVRCAGITHAPFFSVSYARVDELINFPNSVEIFGSYLHAE